MASPAHLDAATLAERLTFPLLVQGLRAALSAPASAPLRQRIDASAGREFLVMPATSGDFSGVKLLTIIPENAARRAPVIQGVYVLFDFAHGHVLATLDADELTARRTAAVSALASSRLSRPDAKRLLLVGSGHLVAYLAQAHCAVRAIQTIQIWARDPMKGQAAAARIRERTPDLEVSITEDLAAGVRSADIISSATRASNPLIMGDWLKPGTHVDLVGGYRQNMREIDDEGVRRARIFVDTRSGALNEAGDLASPLGRGVITEADIAGDIVSLAAGDGRNGADEITLFKSVGWAVADLAAACIAWRNGDRPINEAGASRGTA